MVRGLARSVRRRFGISAPKLAVRMHYAWYWRWLALVLAAALAYAIGHWVYDEGRRIAGFDSSRSEGELTRLSAEVVRLESENAELKRDYLAAERQLQVDQATRTDLARSVKTLQDENTRLKEDVLFFQSMMAPDRGKAGVSVNRFKVERTVVQGEYRYRLLLLQTGQRERDFNGRVQLLAKVVRDGRQEAVPVSAPADGEARGYPVSFRFYQPVEGTYRVPDGAELKSIEARVFETGVTQPRVVQAAGPL